MSELVRLDSLNVGDEYRDIIFDNDGNPKTLYIGTVIGRHESGKIIIQTLEHADLMVEKIEQE